MVLIRMNCHIIKQLYKNMNEKNDIKILYHINQSQSIFYIFSKIATSRVMNILAF